MRDLGETEELRNDRGIQEEQKDPERKKESRSNSGGKEILEGDKRN